MSFQADLLKLETHEETSDDPTERQLKRPRRRRDFYDGEGSSGIFAAQALHA